jgi:hypothetical protein
MKTFEDLSFLSLPHSSSERVPTPLIPLLNLFAGQLYLKNYAAYRDLCYLLGLYVDAAPTLNTSPIRINSDGFVAPSSRQALGIVGVSLFAKSPVAFLKELIGFRRKGQDYEPSHVGQMLHGRLLLPKDF